MRTEMLSVHRAKAGLGQGTRKGPKARLAQKKQLGRLACCRNV